MQEILDGLARIINRWCKTSTPLIANTSIGNEYISVYTARRFEKGDQIIIRDSQGKGESPLYIDEVIDNQTIRLTEPVKFLWDINHSPVIEKTFYQTFLQKTYIGEPLNIPKFPAIVIKAITSSSEFIALRTTKEEYKVQITIYVEHSDQEDAYRWQMKMAKTIQNGLKSNIHPLIGPFTTSGLVANAFAGDFFIKVASTANFYSPGVCFLEDPWSYQEVSIKSIIDDNTIELFHPLVYDFNTTYNPILILADRWIYNSWPNTITHGVVFKGTSLKAASIDWFAQETEDHNIATSEPHLR